MCYLDKHKVEGTDEAQKEKSEKYHAVALSFDLGRLIHSIIEEHVDNGAISNEEAGADGDEHDQGHDLVRVLVGILWLHALPVYLVQEYHIREQVESLDDRCLDLLGNGEHVDVLLLFDLLVLVQLFQLALNHLASNALAAAFEALAEDAVEEAVVLVVVQAIAHFVQVHLH